MAVHKYTLWLLQFFLLLRDLFTEEMQEIKGQDISIFALSCLEKILKMAASSK